MAISSLSLNEFRRAALRARSEALRAAPPVAPKAAARPTARAHSRDTFEPAALNRRFVDQTTPFSVGAVGKAPAVSFTAGMAVDTDGSGPSHGDKSHQRTTALQIRGKSANADVTPYVALPPSVAAAAGMKKGDLVKVTAPNGKVGYAIFGDVSDDKRSRKVGEGSPALLRSLGYSGATLNPNSGGLARGVKYDLLPGTGRQFGTLAGGFPDTATVNRLGAAATSR